MTKKPGPEAQEGHLLAAIADEMVSICSRYIGKGPERCKAHWAGSDTIVIVQTGGFTAAERTLFEAGEGALVRDSRAALQRTLARLMQETVEQLTGRSVTALLSASHQDPDVSVQVFVLESKVIASG